ncbi:hypothetical protein NDU88_004256 [Pleurodeles waltl]|uniref:Uncharacterized protein n=1 Tax=Pleurodeles waltl TaxID=8319 RepID=A0AAV7SIE6_PLEWA|nr:hypothetical protein NDU88_004256 [Pleurodeles waltl]
MRERTCEWKEGDLVRVKSPRVMIKGLSKFSDRKRIIQVGDSAVKLDDGKWWNKCKISVSKVVCNNKNAQSAKQDVCENNNVSRTSIPTVRHSMRTPRSVKVPKKFDDYVLMQR